MCIRDRCVACADVIETDDEVRFVDDEIIHDECTDVGVESDPVPAVCPLCHLTSCDCESETA